MYKKYSIQDFLEIKLAVCGSFSPDGSKIVFLSNLTGTLQLYLIPRAGGDFEQITFYDESLAFAVFSPVKDEIIFGMGNGGDEKIQFYIYDVATKSIRPITNKPDFIYRWGGWSRDGKKITYSSNEKNGTDFDIYVMEIESGKIKMVFGHGGWCDSFGFSPNSKEIVVRKQHTFLHHDLYLVNLESGGIKLLTSHEDKAEYGMPWWLPDESGFLFTSSETKDLVGLSFYDIKQGKSEYILTPDWNLVEISLSPDGKKLAVVLNEDGYGKLTVYNTETLTPIKDQSFPVGIISRTCWSRDGKYLLFNFESATKNSDIWVWSNDDNKYWQLTHSPRRMPEEIFVEPELICYESFDGLSIPAFIFMPKNKDGNMPAIVYIHGGPEGQYRPGFNPLMQYFVYRGYAVIAPNVRGSSGYGKKYLALDDIEKRMESVVDLEFLHKYLKNRGEINPRKIALMGGSYGGYMTLAGLTFSPDLWAAGVDIVGISNLVTFLENTSSWRRALREAEYGYLKTDRKLLESISPINFIQNIKSPLLIIHGKNDPRVPLSEAEQIHRQLRERGMKSEILVYEDEGHGLAKLKNCLDAYPKVADFFDYYLR